MLEHRFNLKICRSDRSKYLDTSIVPNGRCRWRLSSPRRQEVNRRNRHFRRRLSTGSRCVRGGTNENRFPATGQLRSAHRRRWPADSTLRDFMMRAFAALTREETTDCQGAHPLLHRRRPAIQCPGRNLSRRFWRDGTFGGGTRRRSRNIAVSVGAGRA